MFEAYPWHNDLPDENLEVCEENRRLFFETMYERQMIWKRRFLDKKERPWTENAILNNSKFTNVYRELDRNSQWEIKNIISDTSLSRLDLVWKIMVFRFFNNPETFEIGREEYGWKNGIPSWNEYDKEIFKNFIQNVRSRGLNPYTTAYLINSMATPGKSRDYCYTELVIPTLHKNIPQLITKLLNSKSPEEIISFLKKIPAVADFIAHEFYQDFTYIARYNGKEVMKFDQNNFTNVGPGASVGIRLIFPNLKGAFQKEGIYRLRDEAPQTLAEIAKAKGEPMPFLYWDKEKRMYCVSDKCNITLHQIEMWLCEFQKYWKMMIGKGKQRSKFVPKTKEL